MSWHNQVNNEEALWFGSGILEVAELSGSPVWLDAGAIRGFGVNEALSVVELNADNAQIKKYVSDQKITFSFEMLEFDLATYGIMRGVLDKTTNIAGTPLTNQDQVVASGDWLFDQFIEFAGKESDGTVPTINSVTGGVDGALVEDTDYFIMRYNGIWGLYVIDSATVTIEAQTITINSDYTPAASRKIESGGKQTLGEFLLRFTNKDENDKTWSITAYKVSLDQGFVKDFNADDAEDVAGMQIACTGIPDTDKPVGEQCYMIETERAL